MIMVFLNEYEIEDYRDRYAAHPVLGPATQTLYRLMLEVNQHSDGWPYWRAPQKASQRLQELIQGVPGRNYWHDDAREDATVERLRKAYTPIKAFQTRTGLKFEIEQPA